MRVIFAIVDCRDGSCRHIQALSYCGKNIGDFIASYMDFCYKSLAGQTKNIDQTEKIK